jgi:hypothetical protein
MRALSMEAVDMKEEVVRALAALGARGCQELVPVVVRWAVASLGAFLFRASSRSALLK